jgi:hypothetical protein
MPLTDIARQLMIEFTSVYRPTMEERLAAGGLALTEGVEQAIAQGEEWLRDTLTELLEQPFSQQSRSPLEVFQDAARFPTAALNATGAPPIIRDRVAVAALPGDIYGLAPASSQELTSAAWRAHLAWGAAKAQAMAQQVRRPLAGVYTRNLMDRSKIETAVHGAGFDMFLLRNVELVGKAMTGKKPPVAFVDLESPDVDEVVRILAGGGVRVIVYGPHVDDLGLQRAMSLGAADAVPRSRFFGRIADHLPRVV